MSLGCATYLEFEAIGGSIRMETVIYRSPASWKAEKQALLMRLWRIRVFSRGKTILLCCEEGFEAYDEALRAGTSTEVVVVENETDLTGSFLKEINARYHPERVIIEYNGTWKLESLFSAKNRKGGFLGRSFL